MIRATTAALPVPKDTARALGALRRDIATHDAHMARVPPFYIQMVPSLLRRFLLTWNAQKTY